MWGFNMNKKSALIAEAGELAKAKRRDHVLWCGEYSGNDLVFWKTGCSGYTSNLLEAHMFTKDEAFKQHKCRNTDIPIPVDMFITGRKVTVSPENMPEAERAKFIVYRTMLDRGDFNDGE